MYIIEIQENVSGNETRYVRGYKSGQRIKQAPVTVYCATRKSWEKICELLGYKGTTSAFGRHINLRLIGRIEGIIINQNQ